MTRFFCRGQLIRKKGGVLNQRDLRVPKPTFFPDELTKAVFGGDRECIYRGGCLNLHRLIEKYIYIDFCLKMKIH